MNRYGNIWSSTGFWTPLESPRAPLEPREIYTMHGNDGFRGILKSFAAEVGFHANAVVALSLVATTLVVQPNIRSAPFFRRAGQNPSSSFGTVFHALAAADADGSLWKDDSRGEDDTSLTR